jgi:hypothetical protein
MLDISNWIALLIGSKADDTAGIDKNFRIVRRRRASPAQFNNDVSLSETNQCLPAIAPVPVPGNEARPG